MSDSYSIGVNRIFYRSTGFKSGIDVTCDLFFPNLSCINGILLNELRDGIYFFDYNFNQIGFYLGVFLENNVKKESRSFQISYNIEDVNGNVIFSGKNIFLSG